MIDTFSPSTRFVTITMVGGRSCHISLQKSFKVLSVGPYNDCFRTIIAVYICNIKMVLTLCGNVMFLAFISLPHKLLQFIMNSNQLASYMYYT